MSAIFKKHLSRRTFVQGMGATIALPLLDAMVPAQTPLVRTAATPAVRLGLCFIPHGAVMSQWTPATVGALELSPTLSPLAAHRDQVVVFSNLGHAMAGPQGPGDNGGDHTRCPAVFLNGVHPKRTDGADIQAGTTIDQIAAAKIGQDTLLPSLELAIEDYSGLVGSCDVGFSCTYMNTIAWRSPTSPLPMEINPRVVFDRMFGDGASPQERLQRIETQRSILDAVTSQVRRLQGDLGTRDRNRVAEYLDSVREIERRIQLAERQASNPNLDVPVSPAGIPDDHEEHTRLMFDLMAIAFQADITRISTFMMAREVSYRTFPKLGISEALPPGVASPEQPGTSGDAAENQRAPCLAARQPARPAEGHAGRRRHAARSFDDSVRQRDEQQQRPQPRAAAGAHGGWWRRPGQGRTSSDVPRGHADVEPAVDDPEQGGRRATKRW